MTIYFLETYIWNMLLLDINEMTFVFKNILGFHHANVGIFYRLNVSNTKQKQSFFTYRDGYNKDRQKILTYAVK